MCARFPKAYAYIGESSRTAYARVKEHMKKCKCDVKSWIWEHMRDCHGGGLDEHGGMGDFKLKVTGTFRKCTETN